ncbi:hypothetical protein BXY66_1203 [Shimia isoporae]|uniref:Uncharacterized protein n=1 Tax=Shimia isoporae TaxID=647720 RepID=A0A4R1NV67_9RHOB|nr:hypothetical protein [Shimia isoporae]TCL09158.1 hypothetical protein BXY66_1203 [Shimia isoporae]
MNIHKRKSEVCIPFEDVARWIKRLEEETLNPTGTVALDLYQDIISTIDRRGYHSLLFSIHKY